MPPTERALTHFFTLEFTRRTLLATSSKCKGVEGFTVTVPYLLQHYRTRAWHTSAMLAWVSSPAPMAICTLAELAQDKKNLGPLALGVSASPFLDAGALPSGWDTRLPATALP
jgi:hypothetical protein